MSDAAPIPTAAISMPPAEADWLRAEYGAAGVILEYGSGGSTMLAQSLGKQVFSVESDAEWLAGLRGRLAEAGPMDKVHLHHADIGPTEKWGHPAKAGAWRRFPGYALSVWERTDFVQPDLVLVDGRFRVGCLLACIYLTRRPLRVLFDDYARREAYHEVTEFAEPVEIRGRMARFEISPQPVPPARLGRILDLLVRPK